MTTFRDEEGQPARHRDGATRFERGQPAQAERGHRRAHARRLLRDVSRPAAANADDLEIDVDVPPLIPPGRYEATCVRVAICATKIVQKVVAFWSIRVVDEDAPDGVRVVELPRYYNADDIRPRTARAGAHSDLRRELMLFTRRGPSSRQRLRFRAFVGTAAILEVRTVTHDFRQRPIPVEARYSVVNHLVEAIAGLRQP